ncbi:MAG: ABC transporter permease [Simkaniaceae bacterium]|nr:ABC transporter permease [Simkaniaceae bacterium]
MPVGFLTRSTSFARFAPMEKVESTRDALSASYAVAPSPVREGMADVYGGLKKWRVWLLLGRLDVLLRYRRSRLGPFWITISMAVMIYGMGFVYGRIVKIPPSEYIPYISGGMLAWSLLSVTLTELINGFTDARSFILQVNMPYSIHVLRIVVRNLIVFAHHIVAIIPMLILFRCIPNVPLLVFALLVTGCAMFCFGILFAMSGARFRDLHPIVTSLLQLGFLLTPIVWKADMIPGRVALTVYINPFYYFTDMLRSALAGFPCPAIAVKGSLLITCGGAALMVWLFSRFKRRIPLWV